MILVDSLSLTWDLPDPFVAEVMVKNQHIDALAHTNNCSYKVCEDTSWIHSQVLAGIDAFLDAEAGMAIYRSEWSYLAPSYLNENYGSTLGFVISMEIENRATLSSQTSKR